MGLGISKKRTLPSERLRWKVLFLWDHICVLVGEGGEVGVFKVSILGIS